MTMQIRQHWISFGVIYSFRFGLSRLMASIAVRMNETVMDAERFSVCAFGVTDIKQNKKRGTNTIHKWIEGKTLFDSFVWDCRHEGSVHVRNIHLNLTWYFAFRLHSQADANGAYTRSVLVHVACGKKMPAHTLHRKMKSERAKWWERSVSENN